ncbi:hypothetical protein Glove_283g37 [Diversispora epigaea]|uniref:Uncharacterized protein n=1 Tax=Diversispora epigaea TaxID=1348612 RepID=A0A397I7W3_9GLOM|nr:hypothetical protein Glove_283g37 [Diversispora epigaea]
MPFIFSPKEKCSINVVRIMEYCGDKMYMYISKNQLGMIQYMGNNKNPLFSHARSEFHEKKIFQKSKMQDKDANSSDTEFICLCLQANLTNLSPLKPY